jgi:hypothetical protein
MNPVVNFIEVENRVISATYRNLMIGAKIQLVDKTSGHPLPEPVIKITSPMPSGSLRISLPASVSAGNYLLRALNGRGEFAARKASPFTSANARFSQAFQVFPAAAGNRHLLIARLAASGVKRRHGAGWLAPFHRNPLDEPVVGVRADDGRGDLRRALAAGSRQPSAKRWQ